MSGALPAIIDPLRLADEGAHLQGCLAGSGFVRLAALGDPAPGRVGEVEVDLHFERDVHGRRWMHGSVTAVLTTTCQRCLKPVDVPVRASPWMGLVTADSRKEMAPEDEDIREVGHAVSLAELVEEELLLTAPMAALHDTPECHAAPPRPPADTAGAPNPFAVLKGLKRGQ